MDIMEHSYISQDAVNNTQANLMAASSRDRNLRLPQGKKDVVWMLAHDASLSSIQIQDQEPAARRAKNEKKAAPLTEEQKQQLERKRKQTEYKEELENQLRQKKHPLDFRPGELDEIKSQFPEF